jgi:hypothetical protein
MSTGMAQSLLCCAVSTRAVLCCTVLCTADGDTSTFNGEELADIIAIWRAVAEDFAPFDVDVTTADPGDAALAGVGQKAIIGGNSADWYGVAGGIAYVNSFGKPGLHCFVFPKNLGPNNPKFIWEAVSHELGHTLGLLHDGVLPNPLNNGSAYFEGQGYWAPLMVSSKGLLRPVD